jgi:hypothetical protein
MECGVKSYRSEYFLNTHTPLSLLSMECGVKSLHRLEYFLNTHMPLSGQGTMTYTNGDVYVGAFENNNMRGQGIWTYAYGDVFVGAYENGWFFSPKTNPNFS